MLANYPKTILSPVAQNGDKNEIPQSAAQDKGELSYDSGFPYITQVPIEAGGVAPDRKDFNGILNEISQHLFFLQNGGRYQWQDSLDYEIGAVVLGSNGILYKALQNSGVSFSGAKDPTNSENVQFWKKIQSVKEHNEDPDAHKELFDATARVQFSAGDFKISFKNTLDGFLRCDGAAVSRKNYSVLFAVIGTKFGAGDGVNTFNIPDFRGRFIQGANNNVGNFIQAGLPNITGVFTSGRLGDYKYATASGAFQVTALSDAASFDASKKGTSFDFNASRSSVIYGRSSTVQPPAIALNTFIKY